MASSSIHLAVAKKYLELNNFLFNERQVLKGTLYPDSVKDKSVSHYTDLNRGTDNISHLKGKVNLFSFLNEHENLNDFERGWFLHLITDYLFFDECFTREYLLSHSYEEFRQDLYFSYDSLYNYIVKKYDIRLEDFTDYTDQIFLGTGFKECLFTKEMIDNFILRVSRIDVDNYIKKIKLVKKNIKP